MRVFAYVIIASAVLSLAALVACSSDGCYENSSAMPQAAFYEDGKQVMLKALSVHGIGVTGDSLLLDSTSVTQFYLPLPLSTNSVRWVFNYHTDGLEDDTLSISYEPVMNFVSRDCGAMYFYRIRQYSYTHHSIDSISLPDSLITNADRINFRIHLYSEL